jgi:hypothetical protein
VGNLLNHTLRDIAPHDPLNLANGGAQVADCAGTRPQFFPKRGGDIVLPALAIGTHLLK